MALLVLAWFNPFFEGSFPWSLSGDVRVGFALYLWWIWSLSGARFSVADFVDGLSKGGIQVVIEPVGLHSL